MSWLRKLFGKEGPSRSAMRQSPIGETHGFQIEWACESSTLPQEGSDLLLFLSDIHGMTGADLTKFLQTKAVSEIRRSKAMAFFTPGFHESAMDLLRREHLMAVRAIGLSGQPVGELLHDIAIYTGGVVHSAELGFGLPLWDPAALMGSVEGVRFRPILRDSDPIVTEAGLVIPANSWDQVRLHDLGRALRLASGPGGTCIVAGAPAGMIKDSAGQIQAQWLRSTDPMRRAGLERRLRRFGVATGASLFAGPGSLTARPGEAAIPLGLVSPYFVTDACTLECVLENGVYLGFGCEVHDAAAILPALEQAARAGWPLVVVAPRVCGWALACMVGAKLRGVVNCAALSPVRGASFAASMLDHAGGATVNEDGVVGGRFGRMAATSDGCVFS